MPFDEDGLYCPNGHRMILERDEHHRMFELVCSHKNPEGSKVPSQWVVAYSCSTCGYIELYKPHELQQWQIDSWPEGTAFGHPGASIESS